MRKGERQDRPRGTSRTCADGLHRRHNKGRPGITRYAQGAKPWRIAADGITTRQLFCPKTGICARQDRGRRRPSYRIGKSRVGIVRPRHEDLQVSR